MRASLVAPLAGQAHAQIPQIPADLVRNRGRRAKIAQQARLVGGTHQIIPTGPQHSVHFGEAQVGIGYVLQGVERKHKVKRRIGKVELARIHPDERRWRGGLRVEPGSVQVDTDRSRVEMAGQNAGFEPRAAADNKNIPRRRPCGHRKKLDED